MAGNKDRWTAISLSDVLLPATSIGAVVDGQEIVIWRDSKGKPHAWEDRCPHRGMRLSLGFVRGDHITCLYHGWQYDPSGQCQYIPAHPELEVPKTITVTRYCAAEENGLVWVNRATDADSAEIKGLGPLTPVRSLFVGASRIAVRQGLSDEGWSRHETGLDNCGFYRLGTQHLLIAEQPVNDERTGLHILIAGTAGKDAKKFTARWAEGLRHRLETGNSNREVA